LEFAFTFWDAQGVVATGAFQEPICLSVLDVRGGAPRFRPDRPPISDKLVIFGAAPDNIARKHPEKHKQQDHVRDIHDRPEVQYSVEQRQEKRKNDHRYIEMIRPISARHEVAKKSPNHH